MSMYSVDAMLAGRIAGVMSAIRTASRRRHKWRIRAQPPYLPYMEVDYGELLPSTSPLLFRPTSTTYCTYTARVKIRVARHEAYQHSAYSSSSLVLWRIRSTPPTVGGSLWKRLHRLQMQSLGVSLRKRLDASSCM